MEWIADHQAWNAPRALAAPDIVQRIDSIPRSYVDVVMDFPVDVGLPNRFELESMQEFRALVSIFAVGFSAMSGLIAALYLYAWRCREELEMTPRERFDTVAEALAWAIVAGFGPLSLLLAWTLPERWFPVSAWIYCVLMVYGPGFDWIQRRMARRRFGES
jgi:amino acid transporter